MSDRGLSVSERRQLVILRWLVLALLLVTAGLAAVVFRMRQPVSQLRQSTHSRELARSATAQAGANPDLAILLALEAVKAAQTPQAEEALRLSLATYPCARC